MKTVLLVMDGLSEFHIMPFMDACLSSFSICEEDFAPESSKCILRLLGLPTEQLPKERAYLELLANGGELSAWESVWRCNLVGVNEVSLMNSFNAKGLSREEMQEAAEICEKILGRRFRHLSDYRNMLIAAVQPFEVPPPHENVGEAMPDLLRQVENNLTFNLLLSRCNQALRKFDRGGIHYQLYPWAGSQMVELPSFQSLHGFSGGLVAKAETVRGLGLALQMEVVAPMGATGDLDTDIDAKLRATEQLLKKHDFVLLHFNGADEAAHRYDAVGKEQFIREVYAKFSHFIRQQGPVKVVVCGDHITDSISGRHRSGPVPVWTWPWVEGLKLNTYVDLWKYLYEVKK